MTEPNVILLFSGKRKSGKDFLCEKLKHTLGDESVIIRISEPLKSHFAKVHNLNFNELMGDSIYKEKYRLDMINWSDAVRQEDPGYFCRAACSKAPLTKVWIVSDVRRKTDVEWFKKTYANKIRTIRISASQDVRVQRGYTYQNGVDDAVSECDLDDWRLWDLTLTNNSAENADDIIRTLQDFIKSNS